ncbi:MAG: DUF3014 domain-containing protein [Burkholderiales bacterium]|nr:DUF3014 domain-containing protein [Burkholderiales bacterium]
MRRSHVTEGSMHDRSLLWLGLLLAALASLGGAWWLFGRGAPPPAPPPEAPAPAAAAAAPAPAPAIRYPIDPASAVALPAGGAVDAHVAAALTGLLGQKLVLTMLQTDGFARRVAATVDNLPREQAPARLWPVNPASGRFTVAGRAGSETLDPANAARYQPFIALLEAVEPARAVALYAQLYPLFQRAYEELGYPGRYFNDRVVEVIDHLLAAPEPQAPVALVLPAVKGPYRPARPWLLYEYRDAELRGASAGHSIMVRIGTANQRRVKARLIEIRRLLTAAPARR